MKFEKVKAGQIVEIRPNRTRGEIIKPVPPDRAEVKVPDTMGFHILTVPAKDLKLVKRNLEARARRRFSEKFTKKFGETSAAMREAAEQKKVKPGRKESA